MEKNNNSYNKPEEVDIIYIFTGIKGFVKSIGVAFYRFVNFLFKNKYWLISLVIFGIILGKIIGEYFPKSYKSEVYVVTNLESSNYLYTYIENFEKDKFNDLETEITSIEIEPVKDVFALIQDTGVGLFKVLLEDGKNTEFMKEESLEKNYKYHKIIITSKNQLKIKESLEKILDYINNSPYLQERLRKEIVNIKLQKKEAFKTIDNINDLFVSLGKGENSSNMNVQTFTNLSDILDMKNIQIDRLKKLDNKLIEYKKPVYIVNGVYGYESNKKLWNKLYIFLPMLLVFIFLLFKWLQYLFFRYKNLDYKKDSIV